MATENRTQAEPVCERCGLDGTHQCSPTKGRDYPQIACKHGLEHVSCGKCFSERHGSESPKKPYVSDCHQWPLIVELDHAEGMQRYLCEKCGDECGTLPWNTGMEWVCEQHPKDDFPHGDCVGPGMPFATFLLGNP